MASSSDTEQLIVFVGNTYHWLDACYSNSRTVSSYSRWEPVSPVAPLRDLGEAAWREFVTTQPLAAMERRVASLSQETLAAHGLSGAQLTYKLAVIDFFAGKIAAGRRTYGLRAKLIDAIDVVLDSLISAVAGGTALKELKDMLRAQLPASS